MASELVQSERVDLHDGRKVRVLSYADGSIRVRVDDPPYLLEECFLGSGRNAHAIIKLVRKPGSHR
jgi:hypothetical protein